MCMFSYDHCNNVFTADGLFFLTARSKTITLDLLKLSTASDGVFKCDTPQLLLPACAVGPSDEQANMFLK
jgi:hypothetical protein